MNTDCHAPGCRRRVAPPRPFCSLHWKDLPDTLRKRLWAAQVGGLDSPEYLAAKHAATLAVAEAEGRRMVCGECNGSGLVEGIGCDDVPWSVECPWCQGSGEKAPAAVKRAGTGPHESEGGGNPRLPPSSLAPVSVRPAHFSRRPR